MTTIVPHQIIGYGMEARFVSHMPKDITEGARRRRTHTRKDLAGVSSLRCCIWYHPVARQKVRHGISQLLTFLQYKNVAGFVTSSSPVPLKTRRVGQRCTLNLSRAETSSRWCGVVVRRGGCQLRCHPRHLTMVQNYVVRRQKPSCS
ncbi:uncharacterized protein TNCV_1198041 [Trichonephila clavipes]|uniref:Uncharacterized protein n=1 Tax=Trichonephila clavipes TaxID=2585209 RepID=A0A8X6S8Q7_TRICX|nr:uncharacterized protein TNCV_1198041 [Trichonephila clavipes]